MFLEHGSFEGMELAITKKHVLASQAKKEGGWYTKSKLETNEAWTKKLGRCLLFMMQPKTLEIEVVPHPIVQPAKGNDCQSVGLGEIKQSNPCQQDPWGRGNFNSGPRELEHDQH